MRRLSLVALAIAIGCGSNPQTQPDARDMGSGSGSGGDGFAMQATPHDRTLDLTVFALGIVIAFPTGRRMRRKKRP